MKDFVETDNLILSRYIFDKLPFDNIVDTSKSSGFKSSPEALACFIKQNRARQSGIFGWWSDIASPYSAKKHIVIDNKMWHRKEQLQYYIYEKGNPDCIGIICALCEDKKASILFWLTQAGCGKHYGPEVQHAIDKELFVTMEMDSVCRICVRTNPNFQKVAAMLTHSGYAVSEENENLTRWNKTAETFFAENPHYEQPSLKRATESLFFRRMNAVLKRFSRSH